MLSLAYQTQRHAFSFPTTKSKLGVALPGPFTCAHLSRQAGPRRRRPGGGRSSRERQPSGRRGQPARGWGAWENAGQFIPHRSHTWPSEHARTRSLPWCHSQDLGRGGPTWLGLQGLRPKTPLLQRGKENHPKDGFSLLPAAVAQSLFSLEEESASGRLAG